MPTSNGMHGNTTVISNKVKLKLQNESFNVYKVKMIKLFFKVNISMKFDNRSRLKFSKYYATIFMQSSKQYLYTVHYFNFNLNGIYLVLFMFN